MNAYSIISYLRRGYFIFPSGVFEKRLCELLIAKDNNKSTTEDTEKCKRLIEYTFGHRKFPKEYIKGTEHINFDNEENVSEFVETLAAETYVDLEECSDEKCTKLIDKIFGLDHAGFESHIEEIHNETEKNEKFILISKDLDGVHAENTPVCVQKVIVFRPTWPPQDCSYKDPNDSVGKAQESSNKHTPDNENKDKKDEGILHPVKFTTTTTLEENSPPISTDHRVMIEPHIDIYADEEEDPVCRRIADSPSEMPENEPEKMKFNLIVYSGKKSEPVEINNSQNKSESVERNHSQNSSTILPHHDTKSNISNIDPVEVDATGLEKTILHSLIKNNVGSNNPFPFQIKWEICQEKTTHIDPSNVSRLKPFIEEKTHLDPPTVENIARLDTLKPKTKEVEPSEIPVLSLGQSSILNYTTHSPDIGEQVEKWKEKSAKAEVTHLDPPTIENISRLDCLMEETTHLESKKPKTKKPETNVVWKDSEPVTEPITPMQKRWLDITNPRPKPETIRLNPLKVENTNEKKKEYQKPENWKDFEKIAIPIPSLQETAMPNLTNLRTKFEESKECTLATFKEKIIPYKSGSTKATCISKKQPVKVDSQKTDVTSNPEIRDHNLHTENQTTQLKVYQENILNTLQAAEVPEENRKRSSGDPMKVANTESSSSNVTVFATRPVSLLEKSARPISRETPCMNFVASMMRVISKQPYNTEYGHKISDTQNKFLNIGNIKILSNKEKAAFTESSPRLPCKPEQHSSHAEKITEQSQHNELDPVGKTVANSELKPDYAVNTTDTKIEENDQEEEDVGPYIYPEETKKIKFIDDRKKPAVNIQDTDNKDENLAVVATKTKNKVNLLENSALTISRETPCKNCVASIMHVINKQPYNAVHEHKSSDTQNKFLNIGNAETISNKEQDAITQSSPCPTCKQEQHSSHAKKRTDNQSQHKEIRSLHFNNETVSNSELKPDYVVKTTDTKIDVDHEENEDVGSYKYPVETKLIKFIDDRKKHAVPTENIQDTDKKDENLAVVATITKNKVNPLENSALSISRKTPCMHFVDSMMRVINKQPYNEKYEHKSPDTQNQFLNIANVEISSKKEQAVITAVVATTTKNKVNKDPPLIRTERKAEMKDIKDKIDNKANVEKPTYIPEYKPEYRPETYASFKKETYMIPQQYFYSYCPAQYSHYVNCQNVYQQSYLRYYLGLAEQYRHYYPCNQPHANQAYAFYEPYTNQSKNTKHKVNDRANSEMDKLNDSKNSQELDIKTVVNTQTKLPIQGKHLDVTKIPTKRIQGKGNIRSRAEQVLKQRMPIETSTQRQVRLKRRDKRDSENLGDKSVPNNMLEEEVPLSVILERVRERNRKEQILLNLRLLEQEQNSSKKGGRDKSPPAPTCPPPAPPRSFPPMSLPPSGDSIPKFCPPKRKDSPKFFDALSTLSVYDNDSPSERSTKAGKRRQLEKRLLGEVGIGINRWIFVQDKALPWSDSETENILECSKKSLDENDMNLWFQNIRLC